MRCRKNTPPPRHPVYPPPAPLPPAPIINVVIVISEETKEGSAVRATDRPTGVHRPLPLPAGGIKSEHPRTQRTLDHDKTIGQAAMTLASELHRRQLKKWEWFLSSAPPTFPSQPLIRRSAARVSVRGAFAVKAVLSSARMSRNFPFPPSHFLIMPPSIDDADDHFRPLILMHFHSASHEMQIRRRGVKSCLCDHTSSSLPNHTLPYRILLNCSQPNHTLINCTLINPI